MLAFTQRERKHGHKSLGGPRSGFSTPQAAAKANGRLGGRPRQNLELRPMTDRSRTINKMLQRGMEADDIADILGTTGRKITDTIAKYRLPRAEDA